MSQAWSIALELIGMASLYYIGQQRPLGWWLGILTQLAWIGYALTVHQWAFIAGSIVYGWLTIRGLIQLRRSRREPGEEQWPVQRRRLGHRRSQRNEP